MRTRARSLICNEPQFPYLEKGNDNPLLRVIEKMVGENVCKMLGTQWGLNEHRLLSLLVSIFFLVKIPNFIAMPFLAS